MDLNELLQGKNINPHEVLVLRHRPQEFELDKIFPFLAADRPDLFNAYQQTQGEKLEKRMTKGGYVASFYGHESRRALFVGLYKIGKSKPLSYAQYWQVPAYKELKKLGMRGFSGKSRSSVLWFDLKLLDFYSSWKGKLIVDWPPGIAWWRRAHKNKIPIHAILEDSALDVTMMEWDRLDLGWNELGVISKRWQNKLSEWRGIYYIFDKSDAKGYVGSAYGTDNLLGRWRNYSATGHGGNRLLRERDPENFRFTILELLSPVERIDNVRNRENSWKERLHTRSPHGLNDN
jgi:hypothetical protein